jgi:hypothetical protein
MMDNLLLRHNGSNTNGLTSFGVNEIMHVHRRVYNNKKLVPPICYVRSVVKLNVNRKIEMTLLASCATEV